MTIAPGYSAGRRRAALGSGLPVQTHGPGWFGVPSRSGGDPYHVQPKRNSESGELLLSCTCTSGQTRWSAQLPCVHAGVVCLTLEAAGHVLWSDGSVKLADSEAAIRAVLGDGEQDDDPF